MNIQINNCSDLLEFIKRKDINSEQATEIVCKSLKVSVPYELSKDEVVTHTEYYISKFCQNNTSKRPIFLNQKEIEFCIKDVFSFD